MIRGGLVSLLAFASALTPPVAHGAEGVVVLTDDRGEPISSPFQVCFQLRLEQRCHDHEAGTETLELPASFDTLRVEGPGHGPASARRGELAASSGASPEEPPRLRVPRKAMLRPKGVPENGLELSLYAKDDWELRHPVLREKVAGEPKSEVQDGAEGPTPEARLHSVPAGNYLLVLSAPGKAPDLHLVELAPGADMEVPFRSREGWSLVVRGFEAGSREPRQGVKIRIAGMAGFSAPDQQAVEARTDDAGLAVFSGLKHALAEARLRHPDLVDIRLPGLTSSPATFTVASAALSRGGWVTARITLDGEPARRVRCELFHYPAQGAADPEAARRWRGSADRRGICRTARVKPGFYTLQVSHPEADYTIYESVQVHEGEETRRSLAFASMYVRGTVHLGDRPAEGYRIRAFEQVRGGGLEVAEAVSDEEGEYELRVWKPTEYRLTVKSPNGSAGGTSKRVFVDGLDKTVDFHLHPSGVHGVVADEEGRPVEEARVTLDWNHRSFRTAVTDAEGRFHFPVAGEGTATLQGRREGYLPSPEVVVRLTEDTEAPPVTLVLERPSQLRGRLMQPSGAPVVHGLVTEPSTSQRVTTDARGRFEIPRPPAARAVQVFATGPGCPLTPLQLKPAPEAARVDVVCEPPASLVVTVLDPEGRPVPSIPVLLRREGVPIPSYVLAGHLFRLGLPAQTDRSGRLRLAALAPGEYEIHLGGVFNQEELVAKGQRIGYLTTTVLEPFALTELAVTVDRGSG